MCRFLRIGAVPVAVVVAVMFVPLLVGAAERRTGGANPSAAEIAGIDDRVLAAYKATAGWCDGLRWELVAAVGWVESRHATVGGASVDPGTGEVAPLILGPALDGTHGDAHPAGQWLGKWGISGPWEQAVGPMQFRPGTFAAWGVDGDGDGAVNPHDVDDAVPTAANYLCGGRHGSVRDESSALRRYNNDSAYVDEVLRYAASLAEGAAVAGGSWLCPVAGPTSFTDTWLAPRSGGRQHQGVDMFAARGTPVVAPVAGVLEHFDDSLGGLSFRLWADDGNYYFGTHLAALGVARGRVAAGTIAGYVGNTGNAVDTGAHLHFEIHPGRRAGDAAMPVNPTPTVAVRCSANRVGFGVSGGE